MLPDNMSWAWAFIIFMEVLLILFFISPEGVEETRIAEQETAQKLFGGGVANNAKTWSMKTFESHFIESGVLPFTRALFIPTEEERQKSTGIEDMGRDVSVWVDNRLDTLHGVLYGVYHRSYLIGVTVLFMLPLIMACLIDALVLRHIQIINYETANAVFYHGAKRVMVWILILPLFILFAPITITPILLITWGVIMPIVLWVGAKNVQEM